MVRAGSEASAPTTSSYTRRLPFRKFRLTNRPGMATDTSAMNALSLNLLLSTVLLLSSAAVGV